MNDRFKFRVWNDVLKSYSMDDHFIDEDGKLNTDGDFYTVEQCTGLKDKNGKLIYEGDIIKGSNGSINGEEWEFTAVIKWDEELHGFTLPNFNADENWSHYYNVIGNIHEDPELLKEEQ